MYRQEKSELAVCERIAEVAEIIAEQESQIDDADKVYLLTVTPLRDSLPDMDFINQHIYFVPYIISYLQFCKCGAACVESTQSGVPHYHMWYQTTDDTRELARIRWIKILQRIANVKIATDVRYYRKNKWYSKDNALFYYKEDSLGQQLFTPYNPIYATMQGPTIDYSDYSMFFATGKLTSQKVIEKASQVKQLEEFYKKSL